MGQGIPQGTSLRSGRVQKPSRRISVVRQHAESARQVEPADIQLVAEPEGRANSFVGTEEYLAPEVINGTGHTAAVDWWSFGILMYELVYGFTPFRGSKREATFESILKRPLAFPAKPAVSAACQVLGPPLSSLTHSTPSVSLILYSFREDKRAPPARVLRKKWV
jgi:phototropin